MIVASGASTWGISRQPLPLPNDQTPAPPVVEPNATIALFSGMTPLIVAASPMSTAVHSRVIEGASGELVTSISSVLTALIAGGSVVDAGDASSSPLPPVMTTKAVKAIAASIAGSAQARRRRSRLSRLPDPADLPPWAGSTRTAEAELSLRMSCLLTHTFWGSHLSLTNVSSACIVPGGCRWTPAGLWCSTMNNNGFYFVYFFAGLSVRAEGAR